MKRIVLAGGSGFLGQALAEHFGAHNVVILSRSLPTRNAASAGRSVLWDGRTLGPWTAELEGATALVNLTGRTVDCRYNQENRRQILESRIESTRVLGQALAQSECSPRVWLNMSTATIYKHTIGPAWDESGRIGTTPEAKDAFSVEVAQAWEDELNQAATPRTRKVALRTAMVLGSAKNSVFPVLTRLVRCGLGGRAASGQQYVSWIHQKDFCRAVEWLILEEFEGPVNLCAPNPLTNGEMMLILREANQIPFGLPAKRWMLELGAFFLRTETELIVKSRRVFPRRLLESGFQFCFPEFRAAALDLLHHK